MTSQTRAYAYLRQGPSLFMTPRQQRRFKRKLRQEQNAIIAAAFSRKRAELVAAGLETPSVTDPRREEQ